MTINKVDNSLLAPRCKLQVNTGEHLFLKVSSRSSRLSGYRQSGHYTGPSKDGPVNEFSHDFRSFHHLPLQEKIIVTAVRSADWLISNDIMIQSVQGRQVLNCFATSTTS